MSPDTARTESLVKVSSNPSLYEEIIEKECIIQPVGKSCRVNFTPAKRVMHKADQSAEETSRIKFLKGCESRVESIGSPSKCYRTRYHGGWKRNEKSATSSSTASSDSTSELQRVSRQLESSDIVRKYANLDLSGRGATSDLTGSSFSRRSSIYETALLLSCLVRRNIRTLAFCQSRKLVELVLKYSHERFSSEERSSGSVDSRLQSYRGGYTSEERRAIEQSLYSGQLIGVCATNALELGVDIGCLDVTLHLGYPGSVASLWQQAGRAGRSAAASTSILVCHHSSVSDQYFAANPNVLFAMRSEAVTVANNSEVLRMHLLQATKELPLVMSSSGFLVQGNQLEIVVTGLIGNRDVWGEPALEVICDLVNSKELLIQKLVNAFKFEVNPLSLTEASLTLFQLRTVDSVSFVVVDDSQNEQVKQTYIF